MKEYVITTLLLIFHLNVNNGHTLARTQLNNIADIYEVNEGGSSITITQPKDDKPKLREIVYLHVIERPYDGYEEVQVNNKTADLDSKRSFTNGHGYQYIREDNEVIDEPEDDLYDSVPNEESLETNIKDNDIHNEQPNKEHEDDETYDDNGDETETTSGEHSSNETGESNDNGLEEISDDGYENEIGTIDADTNKNQPIKHELDVKFDDDTNIGIEESDTQLNPVNRKRRQIDYTNLPDAPSLPEFKLDNLPDYIKAMLLDKPDTHQKPMLDENLEEEIEEQVRNIEKAVNQPSVNNDHKRETRTYGMSLAGDSGVVWNDVNAGHLLYHVGEPENVTSTSSKPEETPTTKSTTTTTNESTEKISSNEDDKESKNENTDSDTDTLNDIEASFDEIDKMLEELIKEAENESEVSENQTDATKEPDSENDTTTEVTTAKSTIEITTVKSTTETTSIKPITESVNENTSCGDKCTERPSENPGNNTESKDRKDKDKQKDGDSKQKEFVKELMKNKYFWQWLQDSSAAYLGVMMKKVDVLIKAEVEKQIEQYFKVHQNVTNCIPDSNNAAQNTTTEKPVQISNATDANVINSTEQSIVNGTLDEPVETNNGTDVPEITTENPIVNITKLNKTASNNTKIDESAKNYDKNEEELAKKHDNKELKEKNIEKPVKIEAQNVYGSSVSNGKVTNIFIFNIGKESDLGNIKPINNGTDGVFVFGLDNKPDPEKVDDNHKGNNITEIGEDTAATPETTIKNNDVKEDKINKPDINQVSTVKPETEPTIDEPNENIAEDSTSTNEATSITTEKQTTPKEPSDELTQKPNDDTESSTITTEKTIESTTDAEKSIDKLTTSPTENSKEITTELATEFSKNDSKEEDNTGKEENPTADSDSTTLSDNEPKPNDNSNSTSESNDDTNVVTTEQTGTDVTESIK